LRISPSNSLAKGFLVMTAVISLLSIARLLLGGDAWIGLLYAMILVIPFFGIAYTKLKTKKMPSTVDSYEKWSNLLFALQGISLACWGYDLATTFYAINVARVATEINPLGWPLGAAGALSYYGPTIILSYLLLFKIRQKSSLYAAIPMTIVALLMGAMNFNAGIGNFDFFLANASLASSVRNNLLVLVASVDILYILTLVQPWSRTSSNNLRKIKHESRIVS
jgi:hypothetical protein